VQKRTRQGNVPEIWLRDGGLYFDDATFDKDSTFRNLWWPAREKGNPQLWIMSAIAIVSSLSACGSGTSNSLVWFIFRDDVDDPPTA
jgi:hypothetical protein